MMADLRKPIINIHSYQMGCVSGNTGKELPKVKSDGEVPPK